MPRLSTDSLTSDSRILRERVDSVVSDICKSYGIHFQHISLLEMNGFHGGLGNAIPLPVPCRRRYLVRYHACMKAAGPLALRGLFAHELVHIRHYQRASFQELCRFMARYAVFALTASTRFAQGREWVTHLEHLTDLLAIDAGEGRSLAAWKRFKVQATHQGHILDSWSSLYLGSDEVDSLSSDKQALHKRIEQCLSALGAQHSMRPFRKHPQ